MPSLETGTTTRIIEADPWLSEQMGRPAFRLVGDPSDPGEVAAIPPPAFVYARLPAEDTRGAAVLETLGFRLVDTTVTLEMAPTGGRGASSSWPSPPTVPFDATFRPADAADESAVVDLARRGFTCSRFHLDPHIDDAVADAIKASWAGNYFRGRRGDGLFVAEVAGRIGGFLLALVAPDEAMVIDLVAVDRAYRGHGLAACLTAAAHARFPDAPRLRVGTQLANVPACGAYQKMGFRIASASYVFHLHVGSGARFDHEETTHADRRP